jgi:tetratricopeptide (TPR) repeat protein
MRYSRQAKPTNLSRMPKIHRVESQSFLRMVEILFFALLMCGSATLSAATPRDIQFTADSEVIESLAPRIKRQVGNVDLAVQSARVAIENSRKLQEPRYLSQAQSLLGRWWNSDTAPDPVLVVKATIEQSQHKFSDARTTIKRLMERYSSPSVQSSPSLAQAVLMLSSLDRLSGDYRAAAASCRQLLQLTDSLYGAICQADIECHTGNAADAKTSFNALLKSRIDASTSAWILSLLAECEERSGFAANATTRYQQSLKLDQDGYTAIALADNLIRNERFSEALTTLANEPASDAVLLRRARAYRAQNNARWKLLHDELLERFREADTRPESVATHLRERAYSALWLGDDFALAQRYAKLNLESQKEYIDWEMAFASIRAAPKPELAQVVKMALQKTGLIDKRLTQLNQ